jgi:hypothetical protein
MKKVVCKNNTGAEEYLSIGAIYEIDLYGRVVNYAGTKDRLLLCFDLDRFEPLSKVREDKLNKLL